MTAELATLRPGPWGLAWRLVLGPARGRDSRGEAIDVLPLTCRLTTRPRPGTHTAEVIIDALSGVDDPVLVGHSGER